MTKLKELLRNAEAEIQHLRRTNEVLAAKVEMVELFACVLHTSPARHSVGMAEDVAWALRKEIAQIEEQEAPAQPGPV